MEIILRRLLLRVVFENWSDEKISVKVIAANNSCQMDTIFWLPINMYFSFLQSYVIRIVHCGFTKDVGLGI